MLLGSEMQTLQTTVFRAVVESMDRTNTNSLDTPTTSLLLIIKKVLLALLERLGRKPGRKDQVFCSLHLSGTHHAHDLPRQFAWMPSTVVRVLQCLDLSPVVDLRSEY